MAFELVQAPLPLLLNKISIPQPTLLRGTSQQVEYKTREGRKTKVRHPKKVITALITSTPASCSAHPQEVARTQHMSFWVQHGTEGDCKAFCIGGVLPQREDARVETANVGMLSSP